MINATTGTERRTTMVSVLELWRPGLAPARFDGKFHPIWSWPVADRKKLWRYRVFRRARKFTIWAVTEKP